MRHKIPLWKNAEYFVKVKKKERTKNNNLHVSICMWRLFDFIFVEGLWTLQAETCHFVNKEDGWLKAF